MGLFKRIFGILGLSKYESHESRDHEEGDDADADDGIRAVHGDRPTVEPIPGAPRRGFSVPVQVAVERPNLGPLIVPCNGDGGVQGLKWYAKRLRIDEDGDVADEFLDQVTDNATHSVEGEPKPLPKFQVKYNARPAKVKNQAMSLEGKLQQCVDCRGKLMWV